MRKKKVVPCLTLCDIIFAQKLNLNITLAFASPPLSLSISWVLTFEIWKLAVFDLFETQIAGI